MDPWILSLVLYQLSHQGWAEVHANLLNICFRKKKSKTIKLFVKTLTKTQDMDQGPLILQSDTVPTELSGLGRSLQIPGNLYFHNRKYRPTQPAFSSPGKSFHTRGIAFPSEKFSIPLLYMGKETALWKTISLWCKLFSTGRKCLQCGKYTLRHSVQPHMYSNAMGHQL